VELKRILQILLRRKWIVIQAFLVIFLIAVVGSLLLKPAFETSAKLWFRPPTVTPSLLTSLGMKEITSFVPSETAEVDMGTKVTLTKVYPLLNKVIYRLQIRDNDGNLITPDKLMRPLITISQDPNSNTITITTRSSDPLQAMFVSNTIATAYIEDSETERKRETQSARFFVEGQIAKVKEDYNNALKNILTFKDKYNTVNLDIETKIAIEKVAELMKQKEDNIIDISETSEKIKTLRSQLEKTSLQGQTTLSVPTLIVKENPQIQKIMQDLSQLKSKLAGEMTDKTESHPDIIDLKQQITELEKDLEKEVKINQVTSPQLNDLERQLAALKVHLSGVNLDISKYIGLVRTLPVKSNEEAKLKLALTASQDIFSSLLDSSYRIGIAEAMTLPDALLVQPAVRPYQPVSPKIILNGIIGALVGLIFSLGLAFVADYVDDAIKTPEELEQFKQLPFLGSIPRIGKSELISKVDANDPVSEAYRTIRHNLKYTSLDKPLKRLLITSSNPKEGKTTTVANLGISFSQIGLKTLLIDTDLRRPALHTLFGKLNQAGLTHVVAGEFGWEAIVSTGINNLSLLPSGLTPLDPGRIFESERLKELIEKLSSKFDLLIMDSAPLLIKSDATVLGRYVDGLIYVVEAGKTSKRDITETIEVLKKANLKILGVALNKYGKKKSYYRRPGERKKRSIFRKIFPVIFLTVLIMSVGCSKSSNPYLNPDIKDYLKNLKSSNIVIQRDAIYKLGQLQVKDAVPEMINLLTQGPGEVKPDIIEAIGKIGDKMAVNPLVAMLNDDNPRVREKAIEALGKIGDKRAVPALVSILEQKDKKSESEVLIAIWALGNIGNKSAVPILNSLLNDNNKYVQYNATESLKKIKDSNGT
jgi:succinoglycan biosynthesis transport protein ExoP